MRFCIKPGKRSPADGASGAAGMRAARTGFGWVHVRTRERAGGRTLRAGNSVQIAAAWLGRGGRKRREPDMRRTGHIRERSPGAFELRYSLGTDSATGKRRMATATVRGTRKDAEKELRRLL